MALFASLWWLWLLGLVLCGAFALWKWLSTFIKTANTAVKMAGYTLEGIEVVSDQDRTFSEKTRHARERFVDEVAVEGIGRMREFIIGMAAMALASMFGLFLVLSIVMSFLKERL